MTAPAVTDPSRPGAPAVRHRAAAAVLLLTLLLGFPAVLVSTVGWPLPTRLPTPQVVQLWLSEPLDARTAVDVLAVGAWLAWAHFAVCVLVELRAALTGVQRAVPFGGVNQQLAARLVAGLLVTAGLSSVSMSSAVGLTPAVAYAAAPAAGAAVTSSAPVSASSVVDRDEPPAVPAAAPPEDRSAVPTPAPASASASTAANRLYTVQPPHQGYADNLWDIAERHLGDGTRWREVYQLNAGQPQPDGGRLTDPDLIEPGWQLRMPADATDLPLATAPSAASPDTLAATVTVQPGDTLWDIADEQLGDGHRYGEIAAASTHIQPDGDRLTDPDLIQPGWLLTVPVPAPPTPAPPVSAPAPTDERVTDDHVTDDRASDDRASDDRATDDRASDASAVAGQTSPAPAVTPSAGLPAQAPAPAGPPVGGVTGTPGDLGRPSPPVEAANRPPSTSAADRPAEPASDETAPVRTAAGIGALLAAGVLALLTLRRARQQRRRRPGQRIAMPEQDRLLHAERDLRLVEDPTGRVRLDLALRGLSLLLGRAGQSLPDLQMVRLSPTGQLELHLSAPADLPSPFVATTDPTVWELSSEAPLPAVADLTEIPAPYPSLVTLGHDLQGWHVLLDLEHTGTLALDGEDEDSLAVLAAVAAELATSCWADDAQITLVGALQPLAAALGPERVRWVPTLADLLPSLEHRAADVRAALHAAGVQNLQSARTAVPDRHLRGDAWTPDLVLLAAASDPAERARLDAVVHDLPSAAVAAVTANDEPGESAWTLRLPPADADPDAVAMLLPLGLPLRPQRLPTAEVEQLVTLLAVADQPAAADPDSGPEPDSQTGPTHPDSHAGRGEEPEPSGETNLGAGCPVEPPSPAGWTGSVTRLNRPDARAQDGPTVVRLLPPSTDLAAPDPAAAGPAPRDPALPDPAGQARDGEPTVTSLRPVPAASRDAPDSTADSSAADDVEPGLPAPLVQVLGPVRVLHARGTVEPSKIRQLTEIAAYLALHPGGDYRALNEAIWPGARELDSTRHTAMSKLRKWLGADADGVEFLPHAGDGYRLHPNVRTDWQLWQQLLPDGPTAAATSSLTAALELVHGKPFAGTDARRYAWAERDRQEMISAIVDVAHELGRRALEAADATLARRAAAAGLQADPGAELLWRDALRAEWAAGDRAGLQATAERLWAFADDFGDDLEDETVTLLNELLHRPVRQTGTR